MLDRRMFLGMGGLGLSTFAFASRGLSFPRPTPTRSAELKNMVGDIKPISVEGFQERVEKARRLMTEQDIDGLFLTGSTDLAYFTNVSWGRSERTFGAVLNRKGAPIWVCPGFEEERAREVVPSDQEIRTWEEHENPYKVIGGIMKDLGGRRFALGPTVRSFVSYGLEKDAPELEQVDGAAVTQNCRVIKTEKEVALLELSGKITKLALQETFRQLREGMSAADIMSIAREAHEKMGVVGFGIPKIGKNSSFPHGSKVERRLEKGNVVLISGGCTVGGFHCDVDRSIVFGGSTDKHRKIWAILKKAQSEAVKAVRPGVACEDIDAVARKVVKDAGYGSEYEYFKHRLGHGVGTEIHEYTYLVRGNKVKLQPGMTFSCEPALYFAGEFGLRIEDDFVVTEDGGRFLGGMMSTSLDEPCGEPL